MKFEPAVEQAIELDVAEVEAELRRALEKYGPFNSSHEGYGILLEEVDELWHEIKNNKKIETRRLQYDEAKQVAAMALKLMVCLKTSSIH